MAISTEQSHAPAKPDDLFAYGDGKRRFTPASRLGKALDRIYDAAIRRNADLADTCRRFQTPQRILITGVEVPSREGQLDQVIAKLRRSERHQVDVSAIRMKPQGKFANVDDAIAAAPRPMSDYDWIVITDDDVGATDGFIDTYIAIAQRADLAISQPAHCFASYASFEITRRRFGSLARTSHFVEIGPLTVLHSRTFSQLLPFPPSRWCWGIDALWSEIARKNGWRMGIVDATPIQHLAPVGKSYNSAAAIEEGRELLARYGVTRSGREFLMSSRIL